MDIRSLTRTITLSGVAIYTVNIILSLTLYLLLTVVSLPVSNIELRAFLIAVPLISEVFNALILAILVMNLKHRSIMVWANLLSLYLGYYFAFKSPMDFALPSVSCKLLCRTFTQKYRRLGNANRG